MPPGFVISAPASGTGKTTLTLALARAYTQRGLRVQCFKCGPDYIDPAFHAAASGRASFNLDSWAMDADMLAGLAARCGDGDVAIAEGAMGLFDGAIKPGVSGNGACADIAAITGWPVVLVLDPAGQAQTAAAIAKGLATFRADVEVAGVILNRVASARHEAMLRAAIADAGINVFGALPRHAPMTLPERHLGLVQAEEQPELNTKIDAAARLVSDHVDLDQLFAAARPGVVTTSSAFTVKPPGQRIALARDAAFSFIYPHLLEGWRAAGAEVVPFSPLGDEAPDAAADVCWLPGGYPELYAGRLAAATRFKQAIKTFCETRPVHGECGGYMVMGSGLVDADGVRYAMTGLLGLETSYAARKLHLGYRKAKLIGSAPGHAVGATLLGHEFHYASILAQPDAVLADVEDASGAAVRETGSRRGYATGSFFHVMAEQR